MDLRCSGWTGLGVFAPLLKQLLEAALEGEMAAHLDGEQRQEGNRRNGKTSKG